MKKKCKEIIAICVVVTCVLILYILSMTVQAVDPVNRTLIMDFITDVRLTDRSGNALGSNIAKDTELLLTYDFSIPNTADRFGNDYFKLAIPDEIEFTSDSIPGFNLIDANSGASIAEVIYFELPEERGLLVTFTDYVEGHSDISGSFYLELAFDESEIGSDDPTTIEFEVGGTTGHIEIEVDFYQPPAPTTSVQKTGTYDAVTGEIEWIVTVNQEVVEVLDGVLVDVIP